MPSNMEQQGEEIRHVKRIASNAQNGETCTTPDIVWFELPIGREKMELVKRKLFDEKKHKCQVCQKEFYNHTGLKNHRMRHGGAKSHLCEICRAAFYNVEGLADH